jgi:hypothetical protein
MYRHQICRGLLHYYQTVLNTALFLAWPYCVVLVACPCPSMRCGLHPAWRPSCGLRCRAEGAAHSHFPRSRGRGGACASTPASRRAAKQQAAAKQQRATQPRAEQIEKEGLLGHKRVKIANRGQCPCYFQLELPTSNFQALCQ